MSQLHSISRLPVCIITGFLGSGKTTLLNGLLQAPGLANSLVIINEFGEIGIDHLLVSTPSENMRLLSNGCLCCAVRGDLVETLADAHRKRSDATLPRFERVLVETSGLADPVPIIQTIVSDDELAPYYRLDTVVALVDSVHAHAQLDVHPEAIKQVAVADLLLLTKTDLADPARLGELEARLHSINEGAEILRVLRGAMDPGLLFGRAVLDALAPAHNVERWLGARRQELDSQRCAHHARSDAGHSHARHDDRVQTFTLFHDEPASPQALATWLTLLANFKGANLLRVKGLVNVEGRPLVVQAVQTVIHEPVELADWPTADRRTRVVFIVRDADRAVFERSLAALAQKGSSDCAAAADARAGSGMLDPEAYARFLEMAKILS
jgi:G3E family GTPase